MNLRDTIDGPRSLNRDIRGGITGRGGTKCPYSTGTEETKVVYLGHFSYVVVPLYVDLNEEGINTITNFPLVSALMFGVVCKVHAMCEVCV